MMRFDELLEKRRSIRKFLDRNVRIETIYQLINDSILAPSAGNEQPWKFIIVNNHQMIDRISNDCKKSMLERIAANPNHYAEKYERMLQKEVFHIFYNAPAVVYILGNASLKNLIADCTLAAGYFMLSATTIGLGTCWVNFGTAIEDEELKQELGIPKNHKIVAPIALGYPVKIPAVPARKEPQILKVIE